MRRRSLRLSLAGALVLVCAAALAFVSGIRAGSAENSAFVALVQPTLVEVGGQGFVLGKFTAASGSGTGSATHVVIKIDVPIALLNPTATSPTCSGPAVVTIDGSQYNEFSCDEGTVHAGAVVRRYVRFTAPSALGTYVATGSASFDSGSGGAGGGGGINTISAQNPASERQTTVVATTDSRRAGGCFTSGTGTTQTEPVSADDPQQTAITFTSALAGEGAPCVWGFVQEDDVAGFLTQISAVAVDANAVVTIHFHSLPVPFSKFKVLFLPNYPLSTASEPLAPCAGGQLAEGQLACLLNLQKVGKGARATALQRGTGLDPGYGGG
jgi:hypothetical protein